MSNSPVKIGIFSDVHGYTDKLKKALTLLRGLDVNHIICAGDLVEKGENSDSAVEIIQQQNIPCVQGNHDAKAQFTWHTYHEPLKDSTLIFLEKLPLSLIFEWAGINIYMSHCNPWQDTSIYVYPSRPMELFKEIIDAVDAKVIILGHTHMPMRVHIGDKFIINPGAIYGNTSSDSIYGKRDIDKHTCGVLLLPDCTFELYDIDTGHKFPYPNIQF